MERALCYVESNQDEDGEWCHKIIIPRCPYCYYCHKHGGGNTEKPTLGSRVAHCSLNPERQINRGVEYELVRQFGDLGATGQPVMNEDGSVSRLQ